ncbi:hypothetical protein AB4391_01510 [Vibrio lentus]|uniref:hypothetical protein n=1 Tax=Vibrio lentus TaxID=136468 RepID=UPI001055BF46|nr:hypothetical protein [Vibrio lentus]
MKLSKKKKALSATLLLLTLTGCSSNGGIKTEDIQLTVDYHLNSSGEWKQQKLPFKITNTPFKDDDWQPRIQQSIENYSLTYCPDSNHCRIIPITLFLDYEIKKNGEAYDMEGTLLTEGTITTTTIDRTPFQLHLTGSTTKTISNALGMQVILRVNYPSPSTNKPAEIEQSLY